MKSALVFASCLVFAAQATPPRDRPVTDIGTAVIRGRVTSASTREPLHRVRVTLNTANPNPPSAVTDTRGQYEITGVPAGVYTLTATRAGYLSIQYGQRRPRESGRALELRTGEVLEGVDMALPRGGVLSGVVSDEANDQYAGVRVEALEYRYTRGRRMLVQAASTTTNDLGQFRLSGLQPGTYVLRASSSDTWDADDGKASYTYAMTYYPGVTAADQAQSVNLNVAQEVSALDFTMRPGRTATITGVIQSAAGEPMPAQAVSVAPIIRGVGGALFATGGPGSTSTRSDAKGAFEFRNLPPGEHMVSAGGAADRVSASLVLSDGDVRSIVLTSRKPRALIGTVVSGDGTPIPFPPARLRIVPIHADAEHVFPAWSDASDTTVARDWSFRWSNIEGPHLFRVNGLPNDWMLSAVTFLGRPVTDTPLDLPPGEVDLKGLQIVLSQKGSTIDGTVLDPAGNAAPDSTVVVFPADNARWTIASRYIKSARPDHNGKFIIGGLPRGTYRIVAREFVAEGQWEDPAFLNSVVPASLRLELGEGTTETVTLKLEPPR